MDAAAVMPYSTFYSSALERGMKWKGKLSRELTGSFGGPPITHQKSRSQPLKGAATLPLPRFPYFIILLLANTNTHAGECGVSYREQSGLLS
jgi:hypothetical protein